MDIPLTEAPSSHPIAAGLVNYAQKLPFRIQRKYNRYIPNIIADIAAFCKCFSGVFSFFIIFVKNDIKIWKIFF